ncbi:MULTISPECIES: lactoylglutathione lyase [unclassified Thioalkalivibrio]|uniref:lactoylglutathione lyase n=1 Tax=unclassified Thioalkalivibrio TaxID=2621013 RepID=UPI00036DE1B7|nr:MULTISPECIES: lactoylglutathione lyase [unclassified Thioalkalivibrio]
MSDNPTAGFRFNHTMLRVKDPDASLDFYRRVFGMELVKTLDFPEFEFTLYFLARQDDDEPAPPQDEGERTRWMFSQRGILELTYNYGTEKDPDFHYHDGNAEPQGFGHICFSVPDLDAAVRWFDQNNVEFVKRPDEGGLKDIAFVKDLDGYWIEILEPARLTGLGR